jgi:hypothetical protein
LNEDFRQLLSLSLVSQKSVVEQCVAEAGVNAAEGMLMRREVLHIVMAGREVRYGDDGC